MKRRRIVVITPDRSGTRQAGIALRHVGIARGLARRGHDVTLASTDRRSRWSSDEFRFAIMDNRSARDLVAGADACLVQGSVLRSAPALVELDVPIIVDLICPIFLENLERYRRFADGEALLRSDHELFLEALTVGDAFLCGSTAQRHFWLGMLAACRRVTISATSDDPTLDRLLRIVPFGVPSEPPVRTRDVLKGVVPGIDHDSLVIWWGGGLWDWLDPLTPIRAMSALARTHPELKLVFTGMSRPQEPSGLTPTARRAVALARQLGLHGKSVFFLEGWVPADQLGDYALESDIAITAHEPTIESTFAVRTRFWTYLWAGLPVVASEGDWSAQMVREHDLGIVVPPMDVERFADALRQLTTSAVRRRHAAAARELASTMTWDTVVEPLDCMLQEGVPTGDRRARLDGRRGSGHETALGVNFRKFRAMAATDGVSTAIRRSWVKLSGRRPGDAQAGGGGA
ncbi:MAG: glycosyltransferase family 4 protein [Planctomycetota bacterium]|jgi:glycosyltransferase involved in cell wall biosynthesis